MTKRDILGLVALTILLLPSTTVADATATSVTASRCDQAASAVNDTAAKITAVRTRQLAALGEASLRLSGLLGQAGARNQSLGVIARDQTSLNAKTAALSSAFDALLADLQQAAAQCGAPGSLDAAHAQLTTVRSQVTGLTAWYRTSLAPDLAAAAKS